MRIFITVIFLFSILLFGCNKRASPESAFNNWNSDLEELKQEVLSLACSEEESAIYEQEIARQSEELNPQQMKKSMENMKEDINCP